MFKPLSEIIVHITYTWVSPGPDPSLVPHVGLNLEVYNVYKLSYLSWPSKLSDYKFFVQLSILFHLGVCTWPPQLQNRICSVLSLQSKIIRTVSRSHLLGIPLSLIESSSNYKGDQWFILVWWTDQWKQPGGGLK